MSKLLSRKVLVPTGLIIAGLVVLNLLPIPRVLLPEIRIAAEPVFELFGFPITNSLLAAWLTMLVLILGSWAITRKMSLVPGRWQAFLELIIESFYGLVENAAGTKWARKFFPIVMTIFLFVIVSNWMGLTPLFSSWGVLHPTEHEGGHLVQWLNHSHTVGLWTPTPKGETEAEASSHEPAGEAYILVPLLRAATTDLNITLGLAFVSVLLTQYFGVKALGLGYFGKFIAVGRIVKAFARKGLGCGGRIAALFMGIIDLFIGVVESISEIAKIVSFSFRLFGNIFAGEVLLVVMAFLIPYLVSLPFYGLEIFVGLVQALVFMMLTVAFFVVAISQHGEEEH
ncbi:MAG: F0F1 ATP synthase subunit A [Anaerolineae bacterium]